MHARSPLASSCIVPALLWLIVLWVMFGRSYLLSFNLSDSLSGRVFLIQKGVRPIRNDFVAFQHRGGGPYAPGTRMLKLVSGVAGDEVTARDSGSGSMDYFVDGIQVGQAKPRTKTGDSLLPGPTGRIPGGHYYVSAPNPDSLDSRYALVGWVDERFVIGRAIRIF